jgi:hypothetical protein
MLYATIGDYARFVAGAMSRRGLSDEFARQRDSIHVLDPSARAMCNPRVATRCPNITGYGSLGKGAVIWYRRGVDTRTRISP